MYSYGYFWSCYWECPWHLVLGNSTAASKRPDVTVAAWAVTSLFFACLHLKQSFFIYLASFQGALTTLSVNAELSVLFSSIDFLPLIPALSTLIFLSASAPLCSAHCLLHPPTHRSLSLSLSCFRSRSARVLPYACGRQQRLPPCRLAHAARDRDSLAREVSGCPVLQSDGVRMASGRRRDVSLFTQLVGLGGGHEISWSRCADVRVNVRPDPWMGCRTS